MFECEAVKIKGFCHSQLQWYVRHCLNSLGIHLSEGHLGGRRNRVALSDLGGALLKCLFYGDLSQCCSIESNLFEAHVVEALSRSLTRHMVIQ